MPSLRTRILLTFVVAAAASRLVPHWPNFTALGATALFCGAFVRRPLTAVLVPLAAMLLSDLVILGGLYGFEHFWRVLPSYVCLALTALLGRTLSRPTTLRVGTAAVGATLLFYLGTNFALWASGILYPMTAEGLLACYVAALPFAVNMLAANLAFSALLFGGFAIVARRMGFEGARGAAVSALLGEQHRPAPATATESPRR